MPLAESAAGTDDLHAPWLLILAGLCLPFALVAVWRMARWWFSGRPLPLPIDGAMPAVRWPSWFGLSLYMLMFILLILVTGGYDAAKRNGFLPWEPLDLPAMFSPGVFLAQIVPSLVGLAVIRAFGRGTAETVGIRPYPLKPTLVYGVGTFLVILPICVVALWINAVILLLLKMDLQYHPLLVTLGQTPGWWVLPLSLVQAAVLAPLAEEFIYRGVLLVTLMREIGAAGAMVGSSLVFAIVHLEAEPQAVLPLFCLGMAMAYTAYRTRSLVAPIVTHSLFNAVMVIGAFYGS